jgi:RNA recognition motif-containing protein
MPPTSPTLLLCHPPPYHARLPLSQDAFIPQDRESGRPRGFAFVTMASGAEDAIAALNEQDFGVRRLSHNGAPQDT